MKTKICLLIAVLTVVQFPAWGALYSSGSLSGVTVPDNSTIGTGNTLQLAVSGENWSLSSLTLTFVLQGGFSADLSGYLRLGSSPSSPYYNLTSLIQSQTLSAVSPTSYNITFGSGSVFDGQNPNDPWTLFFADNSLGGTTAVNGWSLDVTAVPEPGNVALGCLGGLAGGMTLIRRYARRGKGQVN